ncbi:hypothetical protein SRHO_G00260590 [Serrasalmus rhombeus]
MNNEQPPHGPLLNLTGRGILWFDLFEAGQELERLGQTKSHRKDLRGQRSSQEDHGNCTQARRLKSRRDTAADLERDTLLWIKAFDKFHFKLQSRPASAFG